MLTDCLRSFALGFQALRLMGLERRGHRFVHGVIADDLQQRPALGRRRPEVEQPAGRLVGQHDSLPPVDRDHAFDHPAQHGRLPVVTSG